MVADWFFSLCRVHGMMSMVQLYFSSLYLYNKINIDVVIFRLRGKEYLTSVNWKKE